MPSTAEHNGSFAEQDAVSLLLELAGSGFSGSVRAEHDGTIKVLYLSGGRLACASSTDPRDRLGPLLRDAGQITAQQLDLAEDKAVAGEALGSVLVNLGFVGPAGLMWGARRQIEQVVTSLMGWNEGTFRCRPGALPERAVNLKLAAPAVVVAAARLLTRRDEVTSRLGSLDAVLELSDAAVLTELDDPDVGPVAALLDGERDLRTVCAESALDDFEAAKVVLGLRLVGWAEPRGTRAAPLSLDEDAKEAATSGRENVTTASLVMAPAPPFQAAERPGPEASRARDPELSTPVSSRPSRLDEPDDEDSSGTDLDDLSWDRPADLATPGGQGTDLGSAPRAGLDDDPVEASGAEDETFSEDLPFDEDGLLEDEGELLPSTRGGSSRTWWIGGALVVAALLVVLAMLARDRPGTPLDTTGGPSAPIPGSVPATPPTAVDTDEVPAGSDVGRDPATPATSGPAAPAPARTGATPVSPASTVDSAAPPTLSRPPAAAVETPAPGRTLSPEGGREAFLDAYRAGDYPRAATLGAQRIAAAGATDYTLQVLVACRSTTLDRMRSQVPGSDQLVLASAVLNGETCYRVGWGTYPSRAAAEAARGKVPGFFTSGGEQPIPVPLSRLSR